MKAFKSKLEIGISMSSTYVSYNLFSHLFYIIPRHYCKIYDSFFYMNPSVPSYTRTCSVKYM
jgi:hypothetical protein